MKKEDIHPGDLRRIILGDAPPEYMLEVLMRTIVIYLAFLVIIRLFGKRTAGQLTVTEMAVVLTLGAIIAPMVQLPDRGVVQGFVLLTCMLLFHRFVVSRSVRSRKVEELTTGKTSTLVKDGILQVEELQATRIPREQLFANIRQRGIYNLGKIKRLYLEPGGAFSLYRQESQPGLMILPSFDDRIRGEFIPAPGDLKACCNCGTVQKAGEADHCKHCDAQEWDNAFT